MDLQEFASYEQDTTLGLSLVVVSPGGQYDASRLVNLGSNRWAFKPELGLSKRIGRWYIDLYGGVCSSRRTTTLSVASVSSR